MNLRLSLLILTCLLSLTTLTEAKDRKPNVIVIFTDDQGSLDAGCYGARDLLTPAIDSIAKKGIRFSQFYAAAAVCSPSRAGLLTGRAPVRAGMPGNAGSKKGVAGLKPSEITMAEVFKAAGYKTAHIGKWHLGYTPETMPNGQGFDYSFGHMGGCIDNYSHFFYWNGPNRHDLYLNGKEIHMPGKFFPDLMVDKAAEFIKKNKEEPFFMYFASNVPHYPYQGDPKWLEYYKDIPYPRNLYNAFLTTLDRTIGDLLGHLRELGLEKDTIIVFQSDHGHSMEERAHRSGGFAGQFRGAKFSLFEGGIRVPAIISWPGTLAEGELRHQVAHSCDWLPTLAELAGVKLPKVKMDGKSLVKVLKNENLATPHEVLHWQMGRGGRAQWAVRVGEWKLIGNARDTSRGDRAPLTAKDKLFLANIDQDPTESVNLAAKNDAIVQRLLKLHKEWVKKAEAEGAQK